MSRTILNVRDEDVDELVVVDHGWQRGVGRRATLSAGPIYLSPERALLIAATLTEWATPPKEPR